VDPVQQPQGEHNFATGFAREAGHTATGLANIGLKIPGMSYLSEKAGDLVGLPKLPNNQKSSKLDRPIVANSRRGY
jgi:hypothetical protein